MSSVRPEKFQPHHFASTVKSVEDILRTRDGYFSAIEVLNGTDTTIMVQDRLGVPQFIPADLSIVNKSREERQRHFNTTHWPIEVGGHGIYIAYSFSFHTSELQNLYTTYCQLGDLSPMYRNIAHGIKNSTFDPFTKRHVVVVTIRIPAAEIAVNDVFYLEELGIIISTNSAGKNLPTLPDSLTDMIRVRCNNFTIDINTVDDPAYVSLKAFSSTKHKQYEKLYICILGQVQEIPIVYDPTVGYDGIEVYTKRNVSDEDTGVHPRVYRLTFEEAFKQLGLATNIHDAKNADEKQRKDSERELQQMDLENKRLTRLIQKEKSDYDQWTLEQKRKDDQTRQEYEQSLLEYKREEETRRRAYEERILVLKNQQLDKDIALKQLTEQYNAVKMEKELYQQDFRNGMEIVKSSFGLAGTLIGFSLQVLKLIPATKA